MAKENGKKVKVLDELEGDEKELKIAMDAKEKLAEQKQKEEKAKLDSIKKAKDDKLISSETAEDLTRQALGAKPKPITISTDEKYDGDLLDNILKDKDKAKPASTPVPQTPETPKPETKEEPEPVATPGVDDIKLEKAEAPKEGTTEEPEEISEEQLQKDIDSLKEDAAKMYGQNLSYLQGLYARTRETLEIEGLDDTHKAELEEIQNTLEKKLGIEKLTDKEMEQKPEDPKTDAVQLEKEINALSNNYSALEGMDAPIRHWEFYMTNLEDYIEVKNKNLSKDQKKILNELYSKTRKHYETAKQAEKGAEDAKAPAKHRAKRRLLHRNYQKVKAQKKIETQKAKPGEEYLPEELDDVLDSFKRAKAGEGESGIYLAKALTGLYDMQEKSTSFKQKREIDGYMWRLGRIAKVKKLQNLTDQQLEDVLDANKVHPAVQYEMIDIYRTAVNTKSKYAEPKKPGAQEEE